jgi:enoyl-CoA hydratase/carnithine racemase
MGVLHDLRAEREDRGFALTDRAEQVIRAADDTREGVAAFFEKRPPRWTGR